MTRGTLQAIDSDAAAPTLFSAGHDRLVKVWRCTDSGDHSLVETLVGHTDFVMAVVVAAHTGGRSGTSGFCCFSGSRDTTVRGWRSDGGPALVLAGHTGCVFAIGLAADGGMLVSGSGDHTIRLWALPDGDLLRTLTGHSSYVRTLAVGVGGLIYSGSHDGTVRVWTLGGRQLRCMTPSAKTFTYIRSMAVSPCGTVWAGTSGRTAAIGGSVVAWGPDGELKHKLWGHAGWVTALAVSSAGVVYSGSVDKTIKVW